MTDRSYAVVPAAGRSVRMGCPKLLMPWEGTTLIQHVLSAWTTSKVTCVVVVVHPEDTQLQNLCANAGAEVVVPPEPPPEMRVSVECALEHIQKRHAPQARDVWLLAPADMPGLSRRVINSILAAHQPDTPMILAPTHAGKRGHPVLFPWSFAERVRRLANDKGINTLVDANPVRAVDCPEPGVLLDLDTPSDVRRWREE